MIFLDVHPAFAQYLPETTHSCDYIQSIPSTNTSIILPDWTCNKENYTTFDFSRFTDLEYLEIGDNSFRSVETFVIDGMHKLTMVIIGQYSFTYNTYDEIENDNKNFHIKNCESLEMIDIGAFSFTDYSGDFELANLPSLVSIKIGNYTPHDYASHNFYYSSLIIRGFFVLVIILLDLPSLQSIVLGDAAFCESITIIIEGIMLMGIVMFHRSSCLRFNYTRRGILKR